MKHIYILLIILCAGLLQSCQQEDPDTIPTDDSIKRVVLAYCVNDNDLYTDIVKNQQGMLQALKQAGNPNYAVLVYKMYTEEGSAVRKPGLFMAQSGKADAEFELIKKYNTSEYAVDVDRFSEVLDYVSKMFPLAQRTLFLWGHGSAWVPMFTSKQSVAAQTRSAAIGDKEMTITDEEILDNHAFGGDNNRKYWMDIDDMAEAIPDGMFDSIWFDCCYMSNIETLYELKGKCQTIVAYPTEIWGEGLPYNLALPYILKDVPDFHKAAQQLYDYYNNRKSAVTVAVVNMNHIEDVARAARVLMNYGVEKPSVSKLTNYSRDTNYPYYDMTQYVRAYANANGMDDIEAFKQAMDNFVTFKRASDVDFNGKTIPANDYSGISIHDIHVQKGNISAKEKQYYTTLKWYKTVWE